MIRKDILQAKEVLELPERASLKEIKARYRQLLKKWHPDTCENADKVQCQKMVQQITEAYTLIMIYCNDYKFSFSQEKIIASTDEEWWNDRFGQDPLWGRGNP
jgi:hypothetical protein